MKGILQTVVLCYTWLPFQRWLLRISAVVIMDVGNGKRIQLPRPGERDPRGDLHLHVGEPQYRSALA